MQNLEQKVRKILKIGASAQRIAPFQETVMGGLGENPGRGLGAAVLRGLGGAELQRGHD